MLDQFFGLRAQGTSVRTEITAGLTTFSAMAYILAMNPAILSESGMDLGSVITATCPGLCDHDRRDGAGHQLPHRPCAWNGHQRVFLLHDLALA